MNYRHKYYGDPKKLDLQVMRDEAQRQSADHRFGAPPTVVLHHHKRDDRCEGKDHETYIGGARQ